MAKVNVWEVLKWECPDCCETNDGEGYLMKGDKVTCESCGEMHTIDEHYCACRPEKPPKKGKVKK